MTQKTQHPWTVGENRFHHPDWQIDQIDCLRFYLDEMKVFPSSTEWKGDKPLSLDLMVEFLSKEGFGIVQQRNYSAGIRQIVFYKEGHLVNIFSYAKNLEHFSDVPESVSNNKNKKDKIIVCSRFDVLHQGTEKPAFIEELSKFATLRQNHARPVVNIISRDAHGFKLVEVTLDTNYNGDFDLHYGKGFTTYHETLVTKMNNTHKGIVIFHGDPGTGKTCYIRNLLCELTKTGKKKIIILPNNTVNYLLDPDFTDFVLELVEEMNYDDEWADEGEQSEQSILLVIEDAEPILMKREDAGGNQGTSNILNMTDGIMNDIFGFQVIATFNTDLKNIDPAVLRSKRLISRKTFNKLSVEDSQDLINHLEIDHTADEELSVADIYALKEKDDNSILIEEVQQETRKIGL